MRLARSVKRSNGVRVGSGFGFFQVPFSFPAPALCRTVRPDASPKPATVGGGARPTSPTLGRRSTEPGASLGGLQTPTFVLHSGDGLLVLLGTTTLAVYKPRDMTRYGRRKQQEEQRNRESD
jgi:hypothetical protein